jgi:hypothetical protein
LDNAERLYQSQVYIDCNLGLDRTRQAFPRGWTVLNLTVGWRLWVVFTVQIILAGAIWGFSAEQVNAQSPPAVGTGAAPGALPDHEKPVLDIPNIHRQPFFWTVMVASVLGWVLGMVKGFDSSKDWLAKYLRKVPMPLLFFTDLLIFVIIGAYIGTGLYQPTTFSAALAAGLTWPVALGALASKTTTSPSGPRPPGNQAHEAPPANEHAGPAANGHGAVVEKK